MTAKLHLMTRVAPGASPQKWVLLLHGILGAGGNWAGFARDLAEARPDLGVLVPDHRLHGRSESGSPPDQLDSCITDLEVMLETFEGEIHAVVGHSFGSKIGILLALRQSSIRQAFVLDADPGPLLMSGKSRADFQVLTLMDALRTAPAAFATRGEFVEYMGSFGFRPEIAGWVGKNLRREGETLHLPLDLDRIENLLMSHHEFDAWPCLSHEGVERIDFIVGERSKVVGESTRSRMRSLCDSDRLRHTLEVLPNAGHWLHVDQPKLLLQSLLKRLI
ncbi:MAG: alpha/beta hydrolase [Planctomycetes bacterium]|nr:alpha/beta hydrolase [Planctomycetota bacterium]